MIAERHKRDLGEAPERCARKTRKLDTDPGDCFLDPNIDLRDWSMKKGMDFGDCRFADIHASFDKSYLKQQSALLIASDDGLRAEPSAVGLADDREASLLAAEPDESTAAVLEVREELTTFDDVTLDDVTLDDVTLDDMTLDICFEESELEAMVIAEERQSSSPLTHTPAHTEELRLAPPTLDGSVVPVLNADFGAFVDPPFLEIKALPNGSNGLPVFSPISKPSSSAPILWQKRWRQGPDGRKQWLNYDASLPAPFFRGMEWEWVVCEQEDDVVFAMKKSKVPLRLCKVPVLVRYSCFDEPVEKPVLVVVSPSRRNDAIFLDVYRADGCVSGQRSTFANQDVQGNNSVVLNADCGVLIDPPFLEIKTLPNGSNGLPVFSPISKPTSSAPILWQKRWRQGPDGRKQWLNQNTSLPAPFFRGMEWEWVVCEQEDDVVFAMKKSKVPLRLCKVRVLVRYSCFDEPVHKPVLVVVSPARPDDAIFLDVYPSKFVQ